MVDPRIIDWLLAGDVAIEVQTRRDLLGVDRPDLQARIATEGWGKAYLSQRNPTGGWGLEFYRPFWTATHYTLLDLKAIGIPPGHREIGAWAREAAHPGQSIS